MIKLSVTTAGHAAAGPVALWSPRRGEPPGDAWPRDLRARPPQHRPPSLGRAVATGLACRAPSSAPGWTPGQLDSRADQPRVSPSCPEWPARSQSRIPPQSELPSRAGNARLPLMTSGCLLRAASGGGCLLPEAFTSVVLRPAARRRARGAGVPHRRAPSRSPQRSDALPGPERRICRQVFRRPDVVCLWAPEAGGRRNCLGITHQ